MSKLMDMNSVKINTSRSGFDLSSKLLYSAKAGELLPVFCQEVIPSEKKRIKFQNFTRTQPVNTAAFTRLREYFDFFFVPYAQLWKQWRTFAVQIDDNNIYASDINNSQKVGDVHPYFSYKQVADYVSTLYRAAQFGATSSNSNETAFNALGYLRAPLTCKLLQYLGYGDFDFYYKHGYTEDRYELDVDDPVHYPSGKADFYDPNNVPLNPFPLLAYQKIYQDFYRDSQWEKSSPQTYNLDYIVGDGTDMQIPVESIDLDSRLSMFDLQYCNWNKDYYMGLKPRSQYGDEAVVPFGITSTENIGIGTLYGGTGLDNGESASGSVSFGTPVNVRLASGISSPFSKAIIDSSVGDVGGVYSSPEQLELLKDSISGMSILLLRQYEMLQRYKETLQSHPTDYKEQIEARFGVSLSWHDSNQVKWLGGVSRNFDINEVVNTNLADGNAADIAGKGVSVGDGYIDCDTGNEFGLVLCIYHVMPILDYSLSSALKLNTKYKFSDYAQPAFDRIGMQAIPYLELFNSRQGATLYLRQNATYPDVTASRKTMQSLILGYGPRYLDYKTQIDRVVGVFRTSEMSWCTPFSEDYFVSRVVGSYNKPVDTPAGYDFSSFFNYVVFKVNPAILNPIFGVQIGQYDEDYTKDHEDEIVRDASCDTDQFLCNVYFDVKDVKNLDYDGMPY